MKVPSRHLGLLSRLLGLWTGYPRAVTTIPPVPRKSVGRLRQLVRFSVAHVWAAARWPFVGLAAIQLMTAGLLAAQVLVVQWLLSAILSLPASGVVMVVGPIITMAVLTAITAVLSSLQFSLSRYVGENVVRRMWDSVLDVSTAVELRRYEDPTFFDRLERVRSSALMRPLQVTSGIISAIGAALAGIGLSITLFVFNPLLVPLLIVGGIPLLLSSRQESRLEFRFNVTQTQAVRLRSYLSVILTGRDEAKEIRAFAMAAELRRRFSWVYGQYLRDLRKHLQRRMWLSVLGQTSSAVVLALTLLVLAWLMGSGMLSIATAGAALVAVRMLAGQVQTLAAGVQSIFESGLFIDDLREFMALEPSRSASSPGAALTFDHIEVDAVDFTYPGRVTPAVSKVTISIGRGEVVALVGENGSGKSTLAKIVAGLYPPDAGTVRWDGVPEPELADGAARASTAVIFQDFVRYAMDVRTNIAFGRAGEPLDETRIEGAARASGVDDFVHELPQGYATPLTRFFEGGHDLSGGQWQRLAIARAFYRDAPLVILDEPSAALDPRAEYDLFSSLRSTIRGRSALIISHRFSTVRNADRIYVLDSGRVAESGTHDELMATDGIYAELFRLQATAYLPDEHH